MGRHTAAFFHFKGCSSHIRETSSRLKALEAEGKQVRAVTVQIGGSGAEDSPTHRRRSAQGRKASGMRVHVLEYQDDKQCNRRR
jgi:hypothetical protein